ncbi:MAG: AI-2E family transporter [Nakamurella sp.]
MVSDSGGGTNEYDVPLEVGEPAASDTPVSVSRHEPPSGSAAVETPAVGASDEGTVIPTVLTLDTRSNDPTPRRVIGAPFRTGLLAGLGLLVAWAIYLSLSTILSTIVVLAISVVLAIGLDPVVLFLMRRGMRRGGAVAVTFFGLLALLGGAIYAIIPPIVSQAAAFIAVLPKRLESLMADPTVRSLDDRFGLIQKINNLVADIGPGAASGVFTAAGIAVDLLIVLVLTLYFLSGLPRITEAAYRLVPASSRTRVRGIGDKVVLQMGGYLGGATMIAVQAGVVAGVFSWIVGLPYPLAIGAAAFVLDFVPVVGPVIIGVSIALLGFTQSLVVGIVAAGFYVGQHLFEAYWLYPRVMRRTVQISSAAVIVAIVVGGALMGVVGAILAVPVAAAVQLIVRDVVLPRQDVA